MDKEIERGTVKQTGTETGNRKTTPRKKKTRERYKTDKQFQKQKKRY